MANKNEKLKKLMDMICDTINEKRPDLECRKGIVGDSQYSINTISIGEREHMLCFFMEPDQNFPYTNIYIQKSKAERYIEMLSNSSLIVQPEKKILVSLNDKNELIEMFFKELINHYNEVNENKKIFSNIQDASEQISNIVIEILKP